MRIQYEEINMRQAKLDKIGQANEIITEYRADGLLLTLRQLYYQFVARGLIANSQREYSNLGKAIADGRLAGLIDWDSIEDRTRRVESPSHWSSPQEILRSSAECFALDKWQGQDHAVEAWIEKEALAGVLEDACSELDISFFACRGYVSLSAYYEAGVRFRRYIRDGREPVVLHLGDHDPSGLDMSRDIEEKLSMFARQPIQVERIALNMDQVEELNPPPNPAKESDSRAADYIDIYGEYSWELDALPPQYIRDLVREHTERYIDGDMFRSRQEEEEEAREKLQQLADEWEV